MAAMSRREFFEDRGTDAAVAGLLAAGGARSGRNPLGLPIGSQTYPHRAMIKDGNFAGLLKTLADIGVAADRAVLAARLRATSPACPTGSRSGRSWPITA